MKRAIAISLFMLAGLALLGTGCSSLKVVQGKPAIPDWVADPSLVGNADPEKFAYEPDDYIYASGIASYAVTLEQGIHDARHDAIRKIAERVGITAEDVYRSERNEKTGITHENMPNVPQYFLNSHAAVDHVGSSKQSRETTNPRAMHVSRNRVHGIEEYTLEYAVWLYRPSFMARALFGDSATRYYDVYVIMRCPRQNFEDAVATDKKTDDNPEAHLYDAKKDY